MRTGKNLQGWSRNKKSALVLLLLVLALINSYVTSIVRQSSACCVRPFGKMAARDFSMMCVPTAMTDLIIDCLLPVLTGIII